jgi:predicted lipid carrier protein YhbT
MTPPFVRDVIALLPAYPPAFLAAVIANTLIGTALNGRSLPAACGKVIAIEVRDLGFTLPLAISEAGLVACNNAPPDATISANAADFIALARREADPDTLFFSRRLFMHGDTELAVLVKNTLDGIDFGAFTLPAPSRVLSAVIQQFRALA